MITSVRFNDRATTKAPLTPMPKKRVYKGSYEGRKLVAEHYDMKYAQVRRADLIDFLKMKKVSEDDIPFNTDEIEIFIERKFITKQK